MHDVNAAEGRSAFPPVVTPKEWQRARDALLVKEKTATRALDALAAGARRIPARRPSGAGVTPLPPAVRELFDGANTAHVATLMRDGARHCAPLWIGVEGDRLAFDVEGCE
jgi:predicted dithiol-disulfide oxidoreductase (DUF899 family)